MECPSENEGLHAIDMIDAELATEPADFGVAPHRGDEGLMRYAEDCRAFTRSGLNLAETGDGLEGLGIRIYRRRPGRNRVPAAHAQRRPAGRAGQRGVSGLSAAQCLPPYRAWRRMSHRPPTRRNRVQCRKLRPGTAASPPPRAPRTLRGPFMSKNSPA